MSFLALAHLVDGAHVRVVERASRASLPNEALASVAAEASFRQRKLERDRAAKSGVLGSVDDAHPADGERLEHAEVRDGSASEAERVDPAIGAFERIASVGAHSLGAHSLGAQCALYSREP